MHGADPQNNLYAGGGTVAVNVGLDIPAEVLMISEISPGVFAYTVPSLGLSGRSRQPLLVPAGKSNRSWPDRTACRSIL